jgi:Fe-S cluster biogenesis protein NfuA
VADEQKGVNSLADELASVVREVLAPMVAVDQGTIEWEGVKGDVAQIALGGACAGCPGITMTANSVVLPALRAVDPNIKSVKVRVLV